jgi:hypothetical protein
MLAWTKIYNKRLVVAHVYWSIQNCGGLLATVAKIIKGRAPQLNQGILVSEERKNPSRRTIADLES